MVQYMLQFLNNDCLFKDCWKQVIVGTMCETDIRLRQTEPEGPNTSLIDAG